MSSNTNTNGLVGYWNFEEGSGNTVFDQTNNGNNGTINETTYNTNVPSQSCQLTSINGCDSVAVLNLTINQLDTSYSNVTVCDSLVWNGITYDSSGIYYSNIGSNNNYSMSFDGITTIIEIAEIADYESNQHTLSFWYYSSNVSAGDLFSKDGESTGRQWLVQIGTSSDKVRLMYGPNSGLYSDFSSFVLNDNSWYHISQVWDSDEEIIY